MCHTCTVLKLKQFHLDLLCCSVKLNTANTALLLVNALNVKVQIYSC